MKKKFKYLLLCLVVLLPIGVSAIKTDSIKLSESKDGYYCYLLANDSEGANSYDPYYSYRMYAGYSTDKPTPRCFDSIYNNKDAFLDSPNCFFDFNKTLISLSDSEIKKTVYHSYSNWSSKISESNKYFSTMEDCIAASMITSSTGSGKYHNQILFVEAKSNSEFYTDSEMQTIKNDIYSDFKDDTQFCYAATMYRQDSAYPLAVYYGYPMFIVDYRGAGDKDDSTYNTLVKEFDSDKKAIINFSGVSITSSPSRRGDAEEGKIVIDGFPYADDSTITFEELDKIAYSGNQSNVYFLVDSSGNLITDSQTCSGLAAESGLDSTVIDNTIEDENREEGKDDFARLLLMGMSKTNALKSCYTGDSKDGNYHCYRYTFLPGVHPMYNTTVWTKKKLGCEFELTEWDWTQCKKSALDVTYKQCKTIETQDKDGNKVKTEYCKNITHSGYNGVPDFYDERDNKEAQIECDNLNAFHIIYRAITITAPILTMLFVTFDLIRSIMSGDPKKVSKFRSKLFRRLIALILLIITPILIHILINTLSKNSSVKNMTYLKCVVVGNGTDIHQKVDKSSSTNTTTKTTTVDTKSNSSNNTSTLVKTVETDTTSKESPNLIKSVTINGKQLDYDATDKVIDIEVPNGTSNLEIDTETVTDGVDVISGEGFNEITDGDNTINIIATLDENTYDVVTINVKVDELEDDTTVDLDNNNDLDDDDIEEEEEEEEESPFVVITELETPVLTESEIKAKRTALANSAKKLKKLTSKSGSKTFWCSKRTKCVQKNKKGKCTKKKVVNPACTTKTVENLYGNKQKYGKYVGGYSCASLVSFSLYDSGIYTAYEVNHVAGGSAVRNINSANSMAKFLVAKGWTVITKTKDLQPGDVIFENRSNKPAVKAGGKTYHPGHVEIYAGNGKTYNTGGTSIQHSLTQSLNKKGFAFALRYNGR
ncbi:MAG: hypothetical protein IKZ96_03385 [Bacilli bacterium]|nr:hypothetical protein [Bacilli bacterium]